MADDGVDFDLDRMKAALAGPHYRLPDGPLTPEQIDYYLRHPEECERVICNDEDLEAALQEVQRLWGSPVGTVDGKKLDKLCQAIKQYEDEHYPIGE